MKKAKLGILRILLCVILSLCMALPLVACGKGGNGGGNTDGGNGGGGGVTQSITLSPSTLSVKEDESKSVEATLVGLEGTVAWTSDKTNIATVTVDPEDSTKATVKGVAVGTAKITASVGGKSATCNVTVSAKDSGGVTQSITLSPTELSVKEEEGKSVEATLVGLEGTVVWTSDKPGTATVTVDPEDSTKATVTGVAVGTATIKAEIGGKSATCDVTVTAKDSGGVTKSITISPSSLELEEDESKPVEATLEGIDGEVHWSSNNNAAIQIEVNETDSTKATITGLAEGTAVLTAEAGGERATCNVTVTAKDVGGGGGTGDTKSIAISPDTLEVEEDESKSVEATLVGIDDTVVWTSDKPGTATVTVDPEDSTKATVTGVEAGTATITAEAGGKSATCDVTVTAKQVDEQGTPINHAANQGAAEGNTNAWNYFADSDVEVTKCEIIGEDFAADNKIIIDYSYSGANWTAFNLLYRMTAGKPSGWEVTFNIKSSVAGKLTVVAPTDQAFDIVEGDNTITKNFEGAQLWLRFGAPGNGPLVGHIEITGIQIKEIEKTQLSKPTFSYNDETGVITIDPAPNGEQVKEYKLNFYQGNELKGSTVVVSGEGVEPAGLEVGNYKARLVAVGDNVRHTDSEESDAEVDIEVKSLVTTVPLPTATDPNSALNDRGNWYAWIDSGLVNATQYVKDTATDEIIVEFTYLHETNKAWYGMRLVYGQPTVYNYMKITIKVETACWITIAENPVELKAGENVLHVDIRKNGAAPIIGFGHMTDPSKSVGQKYILSNIEFTSEAPPAA